MGKSAKDIGNKFSSLGAAFVVPPEEIANRLASIKAFILDWDGVFNDGVKTGDQGSPFSEVDSMGLNMLRFSYYLRFGFIPAIFIITGENNQPAIRLSQREHFNGAYIKTGNKQHALQHLLKVHGLAPEHVAFVFDDILDLGLAAEVGLRFFVQRPATPLLQHYIAENGLVEYYTANSGANQAVREVCELSIGLLGNYDKVLTERIHQSSAYQPYLAARNKIPVRYFTLKDNQIAEFSLA